MLSAQSTQSIDSNALIIAPEKQRQAISDKEPSILADIYQDNINIAVWQRELSDNIKLAVQRFLISNSKFQSSHTVSPQNALSSIQNIFGPTGEPELSNNIAELVDMFCCLFELKHAGLRITALSKP